MVPRIPLEVVEVCGEPSTEGGSCGVLCRLIVCWRLGAVRGRSPYVHDKATSCLVHWLQGWARSHRTLRRRHSVQEYAGRRRLRVGWEGVSIYAMFPVTGPRDSERFELASVEK